MKPVQQKAVVCSTMVLGVAVWIGMGYKFDAADKLDHKPNIAGLKGSPYGKVLALAVQGPIDKYWHKGTTHEAEEILHGGHDHDHGHEHHGHEHHGHEHHGHEHHGHNDHEDGEVAQTTVSDKPLHVRAKERINRMSAYIYRKTDGKPLTRGHQEYIQSVTEDKLRLAYELDPSNYTNYGNYHLFIATTTFGKCDANDDAAVALARRTVDYCKRDQVDPASWLTAASAAYNVIFHIGRYYEQFSVEEAKASLAEFDYCIGEYIRLRTLALAEGRILSQARLDEMETRAKYLGKLRHAQGVYMQRIMSTKMAQTDNKSRGIQ